MIIIGDSSIVSKWRFKLIDDPRVVIYDSNRFIIQATGDYIFVLHLNDIIFVHIGINVIKLFTDVIYELFNKLEVFFWQAFPT